MGSAHLHTPPKVGVRWVQINATHFDQQGQKRGFRRGASMGGHHGSFPKNLR